MNRPLVTALCSLGLLVPSLASAQDANQTGSFSVRFDKITDNCSASGLTLEKETIGISRQGKQLQISIPAIPDLRGRVGRKGKLRAETTAPTQKGATEGGRSDTGKFALNGRVSPQGKLQGVFMVEFYRGDKPLCTQSWSLSGSRKK